tara:strand:+ start:436 stop:645 length:210 start_codon:yes stop_codon:yes gene_type:complete
MIPKKDKLDNLQKNEIKNQTFKLSEKNTVDINILLNRVRASEKKQKFNTIITFSLIGFIILSLGLISTF